MKYSTLVIILGLIIGLSIFFMSRGKAKYEEVKLDRHLSAFEIITQASNNCEGQINMSVMINDTGYIITWIFEDVPPEFVKTIHAY